MIDSVLRALALQQVECRRTLKGAAVPCSQLQLRIEVRVRLRHLTPWIKRPRLPVSGHDDERFAVAALPQVGCSDEPVGLVVHQERRIGPMPDEMLIKAVRFKEMADRA